MSSDSPTLSVVLPIYNEQAALDSLFERLTTTLDATGMAWEVVAVDDGSTDGSRELLRAHRARDPRIRVVVLVRNFGQSPALYAGFSRARGRFVVMLDADLQNPPEDIPRLVEKLEQGYDMVSGRRATRQDSFFRTAPSRWLNRYISAVTRVPLSDHGCAIKAFRRELVDRMLTLTHRCRYLPADAAMLGGRVTEIDVSHAGRPHGQSKYGPIKLIRTAFDLITSVTAAPLQAIGLFGWFLAGIGFLMSLWVAYVRVTQGDINQMGTVVAVFFFLSGCQLVATGLMCEYISRIYIEVQARPYYVIQEELE
ncbi:MAG: glycosyltransferase [Candidatus Hydrogenedentes bacterium]|nr:glycosyltransferase [Candidatus Hydrogenedentota bacterium]